MTRSRPTRPVAALAAAAALVATACLPAAQHFHALAATWNAEIDDLTGSIVEVRADPAPAAAVTGPPAVDESTPAVDAPAEATDAITVRNVSSDTIEIGWRGRPTTDTPGWFRFTSTATGLLVRYEVIAPLSVASGVTYAFEVRFNHAVAASAVTARPADWP